MIKENGGPAFPQPTEYDHHGQILNYASPGMTLRDYFAAEALQALIAHYGTYDNATGEEQAAAQAYCFADAMLKARNEDPA
jgi:hypothetical protein